MRVGVFGATGQVGGVMRTLLAERDFPATEVRFFASARSAGREAALEGHRDHRRGHRDRGLQRPRPRAVLQRQDRVAGDGAQGGGRRRRGDRQLVGLADGPGRAAGRLRGQPRGRARPPKGIIANPNCTTMAAMPVLEPLHAAAGLRPAAGCRPTRRCPARVAPAWPNSTARSRPWPTHAAELAFDGSRGRLPRAREVRQDHRLQRAAAGRLDRGRRLGRDRRGAEAPQRVAQDPAPARSAGVGHLRTRPRVHRTLAGHPRRVRRRPQPRAGHRAAGRGSGCRADGRAHAARRRRAGPELRRPDPGRPGGAGRARGWSCSCPTTTCARAPPSTRCRSPSCWLRNGPAADRATDDECTRPSTLRVAA